MKKFMDRRIISIIAAAVVLLAMSVSLAGCGNSGGQTDDADGADSSTSKYLPVCVTMKDGESEDEWRVYRYEYDEHGNPVKCEKSIYGTEMTDTYENTYRSDGTLEEVLLKRASDPEEDGNIVYDDVVMKYDGEGRLVTRTDSESSETYSYNEQGLLERVETIPAEDEGSKMVNDYEYEGAGEDGMPHKRLGYITDYFEGEAEPRFLDSTLEYGENGYASHLVYEEDDDSIPYYDFSYEINDGLITKGTCSYDDGASVAFSFELEYDTANKNTETIHEKYVEYINGVRDII